jgi:hypothetical protein
MDTPASTVVRSAGPASLDVAASAAAQLRADPLAVASTASAAAPSAVAAASMVEVVSTVEAAPTVAVAGKFYLN